MIYLDNGATSFPKPRQVTDAVLEAMTQYCANPGRSSHFLAARTAQEIYKTRAALALLLGLDDPGRILFTKNCTEALNLALRGILRKGDHVVTSSMEHNAVLRPLKALEKEGVEILSCGACLDYYDLKDHLEAGDVTNMYSNVEIMHEYDNTIVIS